MPTYDYVCQECEHEFEAFQSITASPLRKCPACGKQKLKRMFGAGGGLIFKGSGFYITDYRSSDYKKKAEAEQKAVSPSSEKSGDGKQTPPKENVKGKSSSGSNSPPAVKASSEGPA